MPVCAATFATISSLGKQRSAGFELESREIPEAGPAFVVAALSHEHAAVFADDDGGLADRGVDWSRFWRWDFVAAVRLRSRRTDAGQRALVALWFGGRADERAQLHQCLVELGDVRSAAEFLRRLARACAGRPSNADRRDRRSAGSTGESCWLRESAPACRTRSRRSRRPCSGRCRAALRARSTACGNWPPCSATTCFAAACSCRARR